MFEAAACCRAAGARSGGVGGGGVSDWRHGVHICLIFCPCMVLGWSAAAAATTFAQKKKKKRNEARDAFCERAAQSIPFAAAGLSVNHRNQRVPPSPHSLSFLGLAHSYASPIFFNRQNWREWVIPPFTDC